MSEETASTLQPLDFEQARVLGALIEKEMTTPEYYPLSLNSLVAACSQSSNREPVVNFDEAMVLAALEELKTRGLAFQVSIPGARVQKYKHNLNGKFPRLEKPGIALMCVLLLRGAQTAGELRQRTERLHGFADIPSIEATLRELSDYPDTPLVAAIPAGGGRKAVTYAHLLGGPVDTPQKMPMAAAVAGNRASEDAEWKERMEREIAELRQEVTALRQMLNKDGEAQGTSETVAHSTSNPEDPPA
jgi:uncharacterized protein